MSKPTVQQLDQNHEGLVEWKRFSLYSPGIKEVETAVIKKDEKGNVVVVQASENVKENTFANAIESKFLRLQAVQSPEQPQSEPEKQVTGDLEIEVSEYVVNKLDNLHTLFLELTSDIKSETESAVENGTITIKELIQHTQEQRAYKIEQLQKIQTIDDFFNTIHPHYTFLNCSLMINLAFLISKSVFLKAKTYDSDIKVFKKETKLRDLRHALMPYFQYKNPPKDTQVTVALQSTWESEKMWMVEELIKTLFGLKPPDECQWFRVIPGSVTFLIDKHVTKTFRIKSQKHITFMRLLGVISLKVGGVFVPISDRKSCFSFNDSLIQATQLGNREAVSFLIEHLKVNVNVQTRQPFVPLKEDEHRIKIDHIIYKLKKLKMKFAPLVDKLKSFLSIAVENGSLSIRDLVECRVNYLKKEESNYAEEGSDSVTTITEFFEIIEPHYNFINCNIIVRLGELQWSFFLSSRSMIYEYYKKLNSLKETNHFLHLHEALEQHFQFFNSDIHIRIEIGLENMWRTCTIKHTEELLKYIFPLYTDEFLWFRIFPELMTVVFLAPKHNSKLLIQTLKEEQYLRLMGVTSLTIGEVCVLKEKRDDTLNFKEAIIKAEKLISKINTENNTESDSESKDSNLPSFLSQVNRSLHDYETSHELVDHNNNYLVSKTTKHLEIDINNNYHLYYDIGSTPLMIACCNDDVSLVNQLLCRNADPNIQTNSGWTTLMYASVLGNLKLVCMLMKYEANVDLMNSQEETALMCACSAGNAKVSKMLMLLSASHTFSSRKDRSRPLHIAAYKNHVDVIETLLEPLSKVVLSNRDLERITSYGFDPWYYRYPLLNPEDLNCLNCYGYSPLHIASKKGNLQIVNKLLEAKADPNPKNVITEYSSSPLHLAIKKGHLQIIRRLLSAKADLNVLDRERYSPLHLATYYGELDVVKMLLSAKADPNLQGDTGNVTLVHSKPHPNTPNFNRQHVEMLCESPLHIASSEGHLEIAETLVENHSDLNIQTGQGYTPLHMASLGGHLHIVNMLLVAGADPNLTDSHGSTPLHNSCRNGFINVVDSLIKGGADPDILDKHEETPLYLACSRYENLSMIKKLLELGANPDIPNKFGHTPLTIVIINGNLKAVELLLEAGANPDTPIVESRDIHVPILFAAKHGHHEILEMLLKYEANINKVGDGWTALHAATYNSDVDTLKLLLQHNADPNFIDVDGLTPLYIATYMKCPTIVKMLLQAMANPNIPKVKHYDQVTPGILWFQDDAKYLKDTEAFLKTINYPTFHADSAGYTPLHVACMHGDPELVQLLLSYQADTTVKSPLGHMALIIAELLGHKKVINLMNNTCELQRTMTTTEQL